MITIKNGDLLQSDCDIICHQVNCRGAMGAGIAKQIKEKFPTVYSYYKRRCDRSIAENLLGTVDIIPYQLYPCKSIANLYAQLNYGGDTNNTDYEALRECLESVSEYSRLYGGKIGIPYGIGCGLAGGNWDIVYAIIKAVFDYTDREVEIWKL